MAQKKSAETKSSETTKTAKTSKALRTETRKNVKRIVEIEDAQKQSRSITEKISVAIANFCGSMAFVWVHVAWFGGWVLMNSVFQWYQFDPFPYTFLTLVVSLEAIFLSTFILISQNHEAQMTERRNHLDLQINMLSEQENTKMLELLGRIAEKVGVSVANDPSLHVLTQDIDHDQLVEQIMSAKGDDPKVVKRKTK